MNYTVSKVTNEDRMLDIVENEIDSYTKELNQIYEKLAKTRVFFIRRRLSDRKTRIEKYLQIMHRYEKRLTENIFRKENNS